MCEKIYRSVLVGCGTVADVHLTALCEGNYTKVTALCDILPEKAKAAMNKHGINCRIYENYEEMLDKERPDCVHICTPHYLHSKMAAEALSRGINVFLEKPAAANEEQLSELLSVEKKSAAKLCVCFQNRFNPSTLLAEKLLTEFGPPIQAFGSVRWKRDIPYYTQSGWRGKWSTEGGGVMINQAIHTLDLLLCFMGRPEYITATCSNHHLKGVIEVEDTCEAMIEFEGGRQGLFYATTAAVKDTQIELQLICKEHEIRIIGPRVYLDGDPLDVANYFGKEDRRVLVKECYGNSHITLIRSFYDALSKGEEMPVTLESAAEAVRVLLAAYRSHDERIKIH